MHGRQDRHRGAERGRNGRPGAGDDSGVARARGAGRARPADRRRKPSPRCRTAGLFRVLQPKRWDGFELDIGTYFDIQMALAEGDMSVAWVYGVVGTHPWVLALFDDRAADDVWGKDNSTLICSSLMPAGVATPAPGGYRIQGRWRYSSGCEHCDWAFLGAHDRRRDRRLRRPPPVPAAAQRLRDHRHLERVGPQGHRQPRHRRRRMRSCPHTG